MTVANLLPMPVLLPLLGAALTLVARRHSRAQVAISIAVLAASLAVAATLMWSTHHDGPIALWLGAWSEPLGIALVADRLSALMLLISSFVILVVLVFAIGQGVADGDEDSPLAIYFPTYLVLSAGVSNAFLAGDLFNLFVGFEMLLFASFVLLTLGGSGTRIRAGTTYVIVSMVSSFLFLAAIAATYAAAGTVNLAQLSLRLPDIDPTVSLALQLMLLTVFGIKAAVFPMSAWLPDSYPSAPVPVSAVFAGLLTKVGVYAIVRTQFLLFPDSPLHHLIMIAGLLTMLVGILGAVAQPGIKRMLSFTLVSHIGYMIFGIGLGTVAGLAGAVYYVAHHILVQTTLFLVVGLIERQAGASTLQRLGGLAAASPVLAFVFVGLLDFAGPVQSALREVFGPILHVCRYDPAELEAVCAKIAARGYGLTLGVHSRIDAFAEEAFAGNPAAVMPLSVPRVSPKSSTLTTVRPSARDRMRLAGLTSRCVMPAVCAASRPPPSSIHRKARGDPIARSVA